MSDHKDVVGKSWNCNEVDWNEYESHRPPYTRELYDIIFQHHERNGGRWDIALDVGAGGGTITKVLLEKFDHIIFSDPSDEYITRAQERSRKEADAGTVTFVQRKFHEFNPDEDFPDRKQVDMITAGTCIHYSEPAKLMSQLGPLLRSGGTVAAFSYGNIPILPPGDPAAPLAKNCQDKIMRWIHENIAAVDTAEGTGTGVARYDNVYFDSAMWKNVRRITSLPNEPVWPEWIQPAVSRKSDGETSEVVHDNFTAKLVDYEFFPTYFHNFAPMLPILEQIKDGLEDLKSTMGDRKVIVKWPVYVILGTKV